ncbi:MAG: response regulator [Candidatus Dechloromonas phosphoritropha]
MKETAKCDSKLRVLIIEDSAELRTLLTGMLDEIPGVDLVGFAETENTALDMLAAEQPDIAIIDLELKSGNGLNVLARQANSSMKSDGIKKLVFSNYANAVIRKRCSALGATAFFDKSFQMDELLDLIELEAKLLANR